MYIRIIELITEIMHRYLDSYLYIEETNDDTTFAYAVTEFNKALEARGYRLDYHEDYTVSLSYNLHPDTNIPLLIIEATKDPSGFTIFPTFLDIIEKLDEYFENSEMAM